jgi:1-acyl-sn-glycerol-3-phosphate acyltransferase
MDDFVMTPATDIGEPPGKRLRSPRRESGLVTASLHRAFWSLARYYLAIWHRLTIHSAENLPRREPFVIIANHCSHLDAIVLGSALPWRFRGKCFSLAAGDVFFNSSIMSLFAAAFLNALPVWRKKSGNRSFDEFRKRFEEPCSYIIFPEGARSRTRELMPFKAGIGKLVAKTDVPVIPCWLEGCRAAWPPGSILPRRKRVDLWVGVPMTFAAYDNNREGWEQIAGELKTAVQNLSRNAQRG